MAKRGERKLPEPERKKAVERYWLGRRNSVKAICADHKIKRDTLRLYVQEMT